MFSFQAISARMDQTLLACLRKTSWAEVTHWMWSSPRSPNAHSTNLVPLVPSRNLMVSVSCRLTLLTRKFMYFCGSGSSLLLLSLESIPFSGLYHCMFYEDMPCTKCSLMGLSVSLFRLITFFVPQFREKILHSHSRTTPSRDIATVCYKANQGDWFVLNQLGKNMDPLIFKDFITELSMDITGQNHH